MDAFDEVRNMDMSEVPDSCNSTSNANNGYHTSTDYNADNAENIKYKAENSTAGEYQTIEQENQQNTSAANLEFVKEEEKLSSAEKPFTEDPATKEDENDDDGKEDEEDKDVNEKLSNGLDTEEKDETADDTKEEEKEEIKEVDTTRRREKESKNYKEDDDDDEDQMPLAKRMTNSNKKSGNSKQPGQKRGPRGPYNKNRSKLEPIAATENQGEDGLDENQCRVCLVKEDLISIFKTDNKQSIADKLMNVCSGIRIQRKDFLPQFICNTCMQSVQVAYNLKVLCETTDKDLRSKLSRSKKKMRRPATEYVLLDATKFPSEESDNDREDNDDEFKLSNEEVAKSSGSDPTDSGSDYGSRRRSRRVRTKKPQKKKREIKPVAIASPPPPAKPVAKPTSASKKPGPAAKRNRKESSSPEKRPSADFSSGSEDNYTPPARKRKEIKSKSGSGSGPVNAPKEAQCPYCNEMFPSQNALIQHKKTHANQPLNCDLCGKSFKLFAAYQAHVEKHKSDGDSLKCEKCEKTFTKLVERKRHMIEVHNEKPETFPCEKCKRVFALKKTLERHLEDGKCPGPKTNRPPITTPIKKGKPDIENLTLGRDLFKCVAPLTTTYWSDSFSE